MNARNLEYLVPYNRKKSKALADSKLATKKLLEEHDIPVPRFLGSVERAQEVFDFSWEELPARFVIKPNSGHAGEGIIVLTKKEVDEDGFVQWFTAGGDAWSIKQLQAHALNILDGSYSLSNSPDTAFFEEKITNSPLFREISPYGIPDVRIIVFMSVPVMAMIRIPTKQSKGRANIAQGALACGIDLSLGTTTSAMVKKPNRRIVDRHPDSGLDLHNIEIPYWDEMLKMAVRCQEVSGLGYIGVDVALDKYRGPVILELNARPGLDIQIANLAPLADRLRRVRGLKVPSTKRGIAIAKDLFGGEIERRVEDVSGLKVVGAVESLKVLDQEKNHIQVLARVDTGENLSRIDKELAEKLKLPIQQRQTLKSKPKRDVVEATIFMSGEKIRTILGVEDLSKQKYKIIIGRRDLRGFLVDPKKK